MRLALIQNHCSPDRDETPGRALNSMEADPGPGGLRKRLRGLFGAR